MELSLSVCIGMHVSMCLLSLGVFISWDTFLILWGLIMGKENLSCLVLSFIIKVLLGTGIA